MSKVYLIKDLARLTDQSIHTLKFYLKIGLIKEIGRSPETGYRYFDNSTVTKLEKIRQLRKKKIALKEIKSELR
ncbi:MAG: MerR family transcriptional regulator [Candidatus Omnitrophica bacterium]|nr:MerR family transcriptional regulator [Candidatus Omnitrophota bacterium]